MGWKGFFIFGLGFLAGAFLVFSFGAELEHPFSTGFAVFDSGDLSSPSDYLSEEDIIVLGDEVIIRVQGATLSRYAETGSMRPFLDYGANGIRVVPVNESEVEVGDIVSFRHAGVLVVHRVVDKGIDEEGVWFEVRGDANLVGEGKIRFGDIEYKTIGVLY